MNASEFTRFLRSKALASGKYVPGIPRDSADLLVEKVAKAMGSCCSGYFYILADIVIDRNLGDFTAEFVAPVPDASFVVISGNSIVGTSVGPAISFDSGNAPADTLTVVTNNPAARITIGGPAITQIAAQDTISGSTQNITNALNTATGATLSVLAGLACALAGKAVYVSRTTNVTTVRGSTTSNRTAAPAIPPAPLGTCGP